MKRAAAAIGLVWMSAACDLGGREAAMLREELAARDARVAELDREVDQLTLALANAREKSACPKPDADPLRLIPADPGQGASTGSVAAAVDLSTIRCAADRCTVPRKTRDALFGDPDLLIRQVRVVPEVKDGKPQGFKLFGIRAGSVYQAVGLQNGDVVRTLADRSLASAEDALAAYATLKGQSEWTIAGERKGAPFRVTIVVTDP